jgi:hypothetical protein
MILDPIPSRFDAGFAQGVPLGGNGVSDFLRWYSQQAQLAMAQKQHDEMLREWTIEENRRQQENQFSQNMQMQGNAREQGRYSAFANDYGMNRQKLEAEAAKAGMDLTAQQGKQAFVNRQTPQMQDLIYANGGTVPSYMLNPSQDPGLDIFRKQEDDARQNLASATKMVELYSVKPQSPLIAMMSAAPGDTGANFLPIPKPIPGKEKEYTAAMANVQKWQEQLERTSNSRMQYEQAIQGRIAGAQPPAAPTQPYQAGQAPPTSMPQTQQPQPTTAPTQPTGAVDMRSLQLRFDAMRSQIEREMPQASNEEKRAAIYMRAKATGWTQDELNQL